MYLGAQDFPIHPFRLCKDIAESVRNLCIPPAKKVTQPIQKIPNLHHSLKRSTSYFLSIQYLKSKFLSRIRPYIELGLNKKVLLYLFLSIIFCAPIIFLQIEQYNTYHHNSKLFIYDLK